MRHILMGFAAVSLLVAALAPALAIWAEGALWVPLAATSALTLHALASIRALARQRRQVWRLAVSQRHVAALDVGRRQRTINWGAVERVDLDDDGLAVVARGLADEVVELRVGASFESYVALSHRLVRLAERRRVPIHVDGCPVDRLPIASLITPLHVALAGGGAPGEPTSDEA